MNATSRLNAKNLTLQLLVKPSLGPLVLVDLDTRRWGRVSMTSCLKWLRETNDNFNSFDRINYAASYPYSRSQAPFSVSAPCIEDVPLFQSARVAPRHTAVLPLFFEMQRQVLNCHYSN